MWDKIDWTIWIAFYALFVLLIALTVSGCSAFGIEFGTHRTIVVEKPPYRMVISGDIEQSDYDQANKMLDKLRKEQYIDHNFTATSVRVIGSQQTVHQITYNNNIKDPDNTGE